MENGTGIPQHGSSTVTEPVKVIDGNEVLKTITIGNAGNYALDGYVIRGTGTPVNEWYAPIAPGWYFQYPGYGMWTENQFIDYTKKAMDVCNELMKKNLVQFKTVADYVETVNIIRQTLKNG